ncbi:unnamed protein product [Ilex paraguariensis]|uniref:SUEL-type lectin domain-containing protein n=1 Tax=Ilex paraguariensis TaxID=185542 RepID=A0ABC8R8U3_9AQUA
MHMLILAVWLLKLINQKKASKGGRPADSSGVRYICFRFTSELTAVPLQTAMLHMLIGNNSAIATIACLGKNRCSLGVANAVFGEDPCRGVVKTLAVEARCISPAYSFGSSAI